MNEAEVLDTVESTFVIVFLILSILSVKKFIKSLLLNCEGIFRSGDICLFVNLATVLNKNLGLFWLLFTFTFMHLADAFIQSDLQLQPGYTFSLVCVFSGNLTHNLLRC